MRCPRRRISVAVCDPILTREMDVVRMLCRRLFGFERPYVPDACGTVVRQLGLAVGDRPETARARTLFEHYPDERAETNEHLSFALDGQEFEMGSGDVALRPSGHDAWVVGDETVVAIDWQGATNYAKG